MPLSPSNSAPLNNPPPALRLHQIHSKMPFGHTNYVPEEETRNLRANFPEPDILQTFKELAGADQKREDTVDTSEPLLLSKEVTMEYCQDLSTNSLSHPDYRKLAWHNTQGDYEDSVDFSKRTKVKKVTSPTSYYLGEKKSSSPSEISTPQLESRYRFGNAIPFCLNPQAAYLIQHATIMGQRKRVVRELGTSVVYLNDRNHFRTLEHHLKARWERRGDLEHKIRASIEYQKSRNATRDVVRDLLPSIQRYTTEENRGSKQSKKSAEKFPDYLPDVHQSDLKSQKSKE
ncbi:unnamed protein product [Echinostoma caproni]|uniref:Uncharacterized protein n=1 Tax=Echinostoma caproni TaxID=27848 RepID=A0A183AQL4_9TREM|nr:unnamed protein product [Echinostoma caproni]